MIFEYHSPVEYHLDTSYYQGPFEKLLDLVEAEKLDVTLVSLARVTDDFLRHIEQLEKNQASHSLIADFLLVASKLVLIKSKVLLPTLPLLEEEEVDIHNLQERLQLYQELKDTKFHLRDAWSDDPVNLSRSFLMVQEPVFYPPKNIDAADILAAFIKSTNEFELTLKPKAVIKDEAIKLQERISHILQRIKDAPLRLSELRLKASRGELIVLFLAVLHIVKDQLAYVEQEVHFGDIHIRNDMKA